MEAILTAEERHELVSVLRELDKTAIRERRQHPRRKTLISLWIHMLSRNAKPRFSEVVLVNVSVNGVGIMSKAACLTGERLVLRLPFVEGGGWLVLCEVRNCRKLASGQFKVGCRFMDKVEDPTGETKIPDQWRWA